MEELFLEIFELLLEFGTASESIVMGHDGERWRKGHG
jgi:hypothetical protein